VYLLKKLLCFNPSVFDLLRQFFFCYFTDGFVSNCINALDKTIRVLWLFKLRRPMILSSCLIIFWISPCPESLPVVIEMFWKIRVQINSHDRSPMGIPFPKFFFFITSNFFHSCYSYTTFLYLFESCCHYVVKELNHIGKVSDYSHQTSHFTLVFKSINTFDTQTAVDSIKITLSPSLILKQ